MNQPIPINPDKPEPAPRQEWRPSSVLGLAIGLALLSPLPVFLVRWAAGWL